MRRGDEGCRNGVAISSATAPNFKPPTPLQPTPVQHRPAATKQGREHIFVFVVDNPHAATRAIESNIVQRAAQLAMQDFRSSVGTKCEGEIKDGFNQVLGRWRYKPGAAA